MRGKGGKARLADLSVAENIRSLGTSCHRLEGGQRQHDFAGSTNHQDDDFVCRRERRTDGCEASKSHT